MSHLSHYDLGFVFFDPLFEETFLESPNKIQTAENEKRCPPKMQSFSQKKTIFCRASLFILGRSYFVRALVKHLETLITSKLEWD